MLVAQSRRVAERHFIVVHLLATAADYARAVFDELLAKRDAYCSAPYVYAYASCWLRVITAGPKYVIRNYGVIGISVVLLNMLECVAAMDTEGSSSMSRPPSLAQSTESVSGSHRKWEMTLEQP